MFSSGFVKARHVFCAGVIVAGVATHTVPAALAQASTTIDGVVASQPNAPAKIVSCAADTNGTSFVPRIAFDPAASLKSSAVTFSFFDKTNGSLGAVSLSPPYKKTALPLGTDTFTCAIAREELVDGTVFPAVARGGGGGTALVVAGLAGVGIIAALSGHGSSGPSGAVQTPSTPTPFTPTPSTPTPSPTPTTGSTATPTATPTSTASATATPTPTATPTAGQISLNPASLAFTSAGATMSTTISESGGYSGTFSVKSTTCGSGSTAIATLSGGPYANPSSIGVTSANAGNCMVVFADASGNTVTLTIVVTTTGVVVNKRGGAVRNAMPIVVPASRSGTAPHKT
jgi:hypothetical protein